MSTTLTTRVCPSPPPQKQFAYEVPVFATPLPNRQIWHSSASGFLMSDSALINGGWWHDPTILAATGEGIEKEEPRAWAGWWNEQIVRVNLRV